MNINQIKNIAKNGVKYIAQNPNIAHGVKIVGEVVKNQQDRKNVSQEKVEAIAADMAFFKSELEKIKKLIYIAIGLGAASLVASVVAIFC